MGQVLSISQFPKEYLTRSSNHVQEIPQALLIPEVIRVRVSKFEVENPSHDFFDKIIFNIGQRFNNLRYTLLPGDIEKIMGGVNYQSWARSGGPETAIEWLGQIYWYARPSERKSHMEQFIKGYKQLLKGTAQYYRESLPSDLLENPRIQEAIRMLDEEVDIYMRSSGYNKAINMWDNPFDYFEVGLHKGNI